MELDQKLFDQIITALGGGSNPEPSRESDQRRAGRLAISSEVLVAPYGVVSSTPRKVKLRSLSRAGAAIIDWGTMQTGDKVMLYLPKPDGKAIPIVCMITNSRLCGGEFRLGMKFLSRAEQTGAAMLRGVDGLVSRPLAEGSTRVLDEIAEGRANAKRPTAATGASAGAGSGSQDRDERVELNVKAMISSYNEGRVGPMYFVMVRDISLGGGVCIVQAEEMKQGEQFVLQIPRPKGKPLTMLCTVVDCRRLDDTDFRIGARFDTRVPLQTHPDQRWNLLERLRRWLAA